MLAYYYSHKCLAYCCFWILGHFRLCRLVTRSFTTITVEFVSFVWFDNCILTSERRLFVSFFLIFGHILKRWSAYFSQMKYIIYEKGFNFLVTKLTTIIWGWLNVVIFIKNAKMFIFWMKSIVVVHIYNDV